VLFRALVLKAVAALAAAVDFGGGQQNDSIPAEFKGRRGRITVEKSILN